MTTQPTLRLLNWLFRQARRIVVFVIGSTVLLIGVVMIVAPGPALIVIPVGLAILATEFVWARKWLDYAKKHVNDLAAQAAKYARNGNGSSTEG